MGVVKKYIGKKAMECFDSMGNTTITTAWSYAPTIKYKTTDYTDTEYSKLYFTRDWEEGYWLFAGGISVIASADDINDYTGNEYLDDGIGTTTIISNNQTVTDDKVSRLLEVKVENSTGAEISIGCLKIKKKVYTGSNSNTKKDLLLMGYYLDSPITIADGQSETVTLRFDFGQ